MLRCAFQKAELEFSLVCRSAVALPLAAAAAETPDSSTNEEDEDEDLTMSDKESFNVKQLQDELGKCGLKRQGERPSSNRGCARKFDPVSIFLSNTAKLSGISRFLLRMSWTPWSSWISKVGRSR